MFCIISENSAQSTYGSVPRAMAHSYTNTYLHVYYEVRCSEQILFRCGYELAVIVDVVVTTLSLAHKNSRRVCCVLKLMTWNK